jgi:hypothetical protein
MNYFNFIQDKSLFLKDIEAKFNVKIKNGKIDLESFIENKKSYIDFIYEIFNYHINTIASINNLKNLESEMKNKKSLITNSVMLALCYVIGEVILKELGGNWEIGKLKKDWAYGFPIILNWGRDGKDHMRLCPIEWIFAYKYDELRLGTFSKMILQFK